MNERIKQLAEQAGDYVNEVYTPPVRSKTPGKIWEDGHVDWYTQFNEKFAELLKQAIYDQVKQELIDDADIDATTDPLAREYLKGCNGGTVDALCHIQNFGVDIDE